MTPILCKVFKIFKKYFLSSTKYLKLYWKAMLYDIFLQYMFVQTKTIDIYI